MDNGVNDTAGHVASGDMELINYIIFVFENFSFESSRTLINQKLYPQIKVIINLMVSYSFSSVIDTEIHCPKSIFNA
jgi:hypothetical protein